jgi:hypothetical protein
MPGSPTNLTTQLGARAPMSKSMRLHLASRRYKGAAPPLADFALRRRLHPPRAKFLAELRGVEVPDRVVTFVG